LLTSLILNRHLDERVVRRRVEALIERGHRRRQGTARCSPPSNPSRHEREARHHCRKGQDDDESDEPFHRAIVPRQRLTRQPDHDNPNATNWYRDSLAES
jgi:hypothetical protein